MLRCTASYLTFDTAIPRHLSALSFTFFVCLCVLWNSRLRDRLVDVQAKEQAEAVRCLSLEKESRTFEELMHLRGTYSTCND